MVVLQRACKCHPVTVIDVLKAKDFAYVLTLLFYVYFLTFHSVLIKFLTFYCSWL